MFMLRISWDQLSVVYYKLVQSNESIYRGMSTAIDKTEAGIDWKTIIIRTKTQWTILWVIDFLEIKVHFIKKYETKSRT